MRNNIYGAETLGEVSKLDVREIKTIATGSLLDRFGQDLEAVVLFGSCARMEAVERSDIDFFVVVQGLPKEPVRRRYVVYDALTPVLRKFKRDVSVIEVDAKDVGRQITSLLINIAHDGVVLYDRDGRIKSLFNKVKSAVKKAGLVRYKTCEGTYGWKPGQELKPGEVFIVKLED